MTDKTLSEKATTENGVTKKKPYKSVKPLPDPKMRGIGFTDEINPVTKQKEWTLETPINGFSSLEIIINSVTGRYILNVLDTKHRDKLYFGRIYPYAMAQSFVHKIDAVLYTLKLHGLKGLGLNKKQYGVRDPYGYRGYSTYIDGIYERLRELKEELATLDEKEGFGSTKRRLKLDIKTLKNAVDFEEQFYLDYVKVFESSFSGEKQKLNSSNKDNGGHCNDKVTTKPKTAVPSNVHSIVFSTQTK